MRTIALTLMAFFAPFPLYAEPLETTKAARAVCEEAMSDIGAGNLDNGFEQLKKVSALSATKFDSFTIQTKARREEAGTIYGEPIGYEFIDQKRVGDSLIRFRYIEKTDEHALPWTFYFYRTPEGWTLNQFDWNDQLHRLF